jgi:hypothetical protein
LGVAWLPYSGRTALAHNMLARGGAIVFMVWLADLAVETWGEVPAWCGALLVVAVGLDLIIVTAFLVARDAVRRHALVVEVTYVCSACVPLLLLTYAT